MRITPLQISNTDWQAYNTLCQSSFLDPPIRRLDAFGMKMGPDTFLGTLSTGSIDDAIRSSIGTKTAHHVFLSFGIQDYTSDQMVELFMCSDVHITQIGTSTAIASGTLFHWAAGVICMCKQESELGYYIYGHICRANFSQLFDDFNKHVTSGKLRLTKK